MYVHGMKSNHFSKTETAKAWVTQVGFMAKVEVRHQHWKYISDSSKIVIMLYAYWPNDKRIRDMSNMHKILPDALQGIVYENDCNTLVRDADFEKSKHPRVEVFIYLLQDEEV